MKCNETKRIESKRNNKTSDDAFSFCFCCCCCWRRNLQNPWVLPDCQILILTIKCVCVCHRNSYCNTMSHLSLFCHSNGIQLFELMRLMTNFFFILTTLNIECGNSFWETKNKERHNDVILRREGERERHKFCEWTNIVNIENGNDNYGDKLYTLNPIPLCGWTQYDGWWKLPVHHSLDITEEIFQSDIFHFIENSSSKLKNDKNRSGKMEKEKKRGD